MGAITTLEQFHREMRDFDAQWSNCPVEKRQRELREAKERERAKEREAREQQRQAANISQSWWDAIDQRIQQHFLQSFSEGEKGWLREAIGGAIGITRGESEKQLRAEIAELRAELHAATSKLQERHARLPIVKAWDANEISYCGDVVTHEGATYQARKDTGKEPPHRDWILLASAGRAGKAADPVVVAKLVGDQLEAPLRDYIDEAVAKLPPAKDGARGLQGERGARGEAGKTIINWTIDHARYRAIPTMSDGTGGPPLELRVLFEQFLIETGGSRSLEPANVCF